MKNFIQPGDNITLPAPTGGTVSGTPYLVGTLFGVASTTEAETVDVVLCTTGVFELAKVAAQAWTLGAAIYWDNTAKLCTTTSGGNTKIGVATKVADNPSSTGFVRLNGAF